MARKVWFVRLAAFLAAVALMLSASFGNIEFLNATAQAEEETELRVTEEAVPQAIEAEEEAAPQTAEEAAQQETEAEEETELQTTEEAALQETEAEEETELQTTEEAALQVTETEEETKLQTAEEAALQETEAEEKAELPMAEETAPQETEAEEETTLPVVEEAVPQVVETEKEIVPQVAEAEEETEPETATAPEDHQEDAQPEAAADDENDEIGDDQEWIDDNEETVDPEEDEDLAVIEDDDAGTVSEEILEPFNNPDLYEQETFAGTAQIRLMNDGMLSYGDEIILKADVRDVNVTYRLVWKANDNDSRGWFTIGSGEEYRFVLDRENAAREYRVEIFAVD